MKNSFPKFIFPVAAGFLLAGCAPNRPVDVAPQVASADTMNVSPPTTPPPEDQKDVVPTCPGNLPQWWFIPGRWTWRNQWVWVPGHWTTRPHSGDSWIAGKWEKDGDIYVWKKGRWRSGAHVGEQSED